ncbi:MAG: leucine-rich repeat protein, partial [Clostridia bacterium]|nr:leucine-rich repeat protein [Clostridia bacterium]
TIPEGVTSIGYSAFEGCSSLTSITIPGSVTRIGDDVFAFCSSLTSITLPQGVTSIGYYAFRYCSSLTSITIPGSVTSIGNGAFEGCSSLYIIYNNSDLKLRIGFYSNGYVAYYAKKIVNKDGAVTYKSGISEYEHIDTEDGFRFAKENGAYTLISYLGNEETITLPKDINGNPYNIYYMRGVKNVIIPEGVTSINSSAFYGCSSLTSITLPQGVTSIGYSTFYGCSSLTSITIPHSVTRIGNDVFYGCSSLTSITLPQGVTSIGYSAFGYCSSLASITIPEGVTRIGDDVFYNCRGLASITIPEGVTSIGNSAFQNCSSLTSITIPNSVTSIGRFAFEGCSSLTSITIPEGVTSIGYSAFRDCSSLTSITIPEGVTSIGDGAFNNCTITDFKLDANNAYYSYTDGILYNKEKTQIIATINVKGSITIPNGVTSIGSSAFYGCSSLTSITIPDSVTSIGDSAFRYCSKLYIVYNNSNLTLSIGSTLNGYVAYYAKKIVNKDGTVTYKSGISEYEHIDTEDGFRFAKENGAYTLISYLGNEETITLPKNINGNPYNIYYMRGVKNVIIPEGVTSIGSSAFRDCSNLTSITIPNSVTSIGDYAFSGCSSLVSINYNAVNCTVGADAFKNVGTKSSEVSVTFGDKVAKIPDGIFSSSINIKKLYIPNNVTSIGDSAFSGCASLEEITYEGEPDEWAHVKKASNWDDGAGAYSLKYTKADSGFLYETDKDVTEFYVSGYVKANGSTVVPESYSGRPVTQVYNKAFTNNTDLNSIALPDTVTLIGYASFRNCANLKTVELPPNISEISFGIFTGCNSLTNITLPFIGGTVEYEDGEYFGYVFGATSYNEHEDKIPQSLTTITIEKADKIGENCFRNCVNVKNVSLPETVSAIGSHAFEDCRSLVSFTVPIQTQTINSYAFAGCSSISVLNFAGNKLSYIGDYAFSGNSSLRRFDIPDSVTRIGAMALNNCNAIEEIRIGAALSLMDDYGLGNPLFGIDKSRSMLKRYVVSENNAEYCADELGILYTYTLLSDKNEKLRVGVMDVPAKVNLNGYAMPDQIVEIAPYSFAYNSTLKDVNLTYVRRIANHAFYCASGLVNVTLNDEDDVEENSQEPAEPEYVPSKSSWLFGLFREAALKILNAVGIETPTAEEEEEVVETYFQTIGERAFMGCTALQKVDLDAKSIVAIRDYAFADCPQLKSVILGKYLEQLGFSVFGATASGESNIERFVVDKENKNFKSIDGVLYSINADGSLTLEIFPASIIKCDVNGEPVYENYEKIYLTEFVLPKDANISAIQTYAFQSVNYLDVVRIDPNNSLAVGDYAFANSRLQQVYIGKNVTSLGLLRGEGEYTVFADTEYLTAIEVESGNKYYTSKNGVLFDKDMRTIIKYPSAKAGNLYEIPDSVQVIASMAFKRNSSLVYVTASSYISAIGLEAFYACDKLTLIYFDGVYAPVSVMENAFTTFVEIEDGNANNPRTQIGYSEAYYSNGQNGEYGWKNYEGTYNLSVYERLPELERGKKGSGYYAVVVLDSKGNRLGNMKVMLTDPNGKSETVIAGHNTEGIGAAVFYDLFGVEGVGFALDFSLPYSLKIVDENGQYLGYTNNSLYLDEDMRITYITLSAEPKVYGNSCNGEEINTETADINKSEYEFACLIEGEHTHEDGTNCTGTIKETIEISVIGYCDTEAGYAFFDENGNVLSGESGLYQNGVKICDPSRYEEEEDHVIIYFEPYASTLANEVDIEARLTAVSDAGNLTCKTVLNIHVFDFFVNEDNVDLETEDLNVDLSKGGSMFSKLFGANNFEIKLGKNVKFITDIEGDTATLKLTASKSWDKTSSKYTLYEQGYNNNAQAHNKGSFFFTYKAKIKEKNLKTRTITYNIRFVKEPDSDGYYYYRCYIYEESYNNKIALFYGGVNESPFGDLINKGRSTTRLNLKAKSYLIYVLHSGYAKEGASVSGIKDLGVKAQYTEQIIGSKQPLRTNKNAFAISLEGEFQLKYDREKGITPVKASLTGTLKYTFEHNGQYMIWVIPVVLDIKVEVTGKIAVKLGFDENKQIGLDQFDVTLDLEFSVNLGVGCAVFSAGVYGSVGSVFVLEIMPDFGVESWEIHGEIGGYVKVLWKTYKTKFTDFGGKKYIIGEPSSQSNALTPSAYNVAPIYIASNYSDASSEELESDFKLLVIGGELYKISLINVSDRAGYDNYNYAKLALFKWNGEDWNEPIIVDDNGKNDGAFTIYASEENNVVIAYTQQNDVLTTDDVYTATDNLVVKSATISADGTITKGSGIQRNNYAYLTQYANVNGVPTLIWAENADNNMFGVSPDNYIDANGNSHIFPTIANSIWKSELIGEQQWSTPILLADNLSTVTDIAISDNGDFAYIIDTNGDLSDTHDRVMNIGKIEGTVKELNNTEDGAVITVDSNGSNLIYYYDAVDEEENDGYRYISENTTTPLPQNVPANGVMIFNETVPEAYLYVSNKAWKENGDMSGSAIYGVFYEEGVWGDPVELSVYTPSNDRYITKFEAVKYDKGIRITAVTTNGAGGDSNVVNYSYTISPKLEIVSGDIDYANAAMNLTVKNNGSQSTEVYVAVNNNAYVCVSKKLLSGKTETYTVTLGDENRQDLVVKVSTDLTGTDAIVIDNINLSYSDIQPFAKQLLLGGKNAILVAVKNTGNLADKGITVISANGTTLDEASAKIILDKIDVTTLQNGVPIWVTVNDENNVSESFCVVADELQPGGIVYHEIILDGNAVVESNQMISIVSVTDSGNEKGAASSNNTTYLTYAKLIGVLENGEVLETVPEILESTVYYDKNKDTTVVLHYTSQESDSIVSLSIDDIFLSSWSANPYYTVDFETLSGTVTLYESKLEDLSPGKHIVKITFESGTVCECVLNVKKYYVITWSDNGTVLSKTEVAEGAIPTPDKTPTKESDKMYDYTFAGWSSSPNGEPTKIIAATSAKTYYAIWTQTKRQFVVTWVLTKSDGSEISIDEVYSYEDTPTYNGTLYTPKGMIFEGWSESPANVISDVTYVAVYKNEFEIGDINGDNLINTRDLALLRQYTVGLITLTDMQLLRCNLYEDYNADGTAKIDTRDIAVLQQIIVGYTEASS